MQRSVCDWLEARKGLKVQHNWVKACLEWIEQEEGGGVPMASLREMVYKQLLHADLRDVVVQPCIPASVPQQQTTTITGHFVVQVDSLIDVGAAAYAQLQKIKGQSLDDFDTKKNFEPKPTRLLLLSLTDGVTDFQAMEYHPIPQLTTDLTLGAKLVLRGTIGCRLGTLLLTGDQVELLGGGVESLAETNQQSRVLARALNDESLAGDRGTTESGPPATTRSNSAGPPVRSTGPPVRSTGNEQLQEDNEAGPEGMGTRMEEIGDLDLENFEDFEDMEDQQSLLLQDGQEQWPDDDGVGFSPLETSMEDGGEEGEGEFEIQEQEGALTLESGDPYSSFQSRTAGQKRRYTSSFSGETHVDYSCERYEQSADMPGPSGLGMNTGKRSKVHREGHRNAVVEVDRVEVRASGAARDWREADRGMVSGSFSRSGGADLDGPSGSVSRKTCSVAAVRPLNTAVGAEGRGGEGGEGGRGGEGGEGGRGKTKTVCPEPSLERGGSTPGDSGGIAAGVSTVQSISEAADVWINRPLVRVKARFVRVTSKLTPADGCWTVAVILEDSSGAQLNVQLSNEVLEKLIGFTAQEFVEHIQPNKRDPAIRARGSKGFKHCQSYLATLNCVMEIRNPLMFGDHPTVERLLDTE